MWADEAIAALLLVMGGYRPGAVFAEPWKPSFNVRIQRTPKAVQRKCLLTIEEWAEVSSSVLDSVLDDCQRNGLDVLKK